jgi:hypothetical protein
MTRPLATNLVPLAPGAILPPSPLRGGVGVGVAPFPSLR